jgi:hypothetical protein
MILNDQLQFPVSDPLFVAAKNVFVVDTPCEMKGRLIQIDANFQNQACPQYYVHKRYALPCQMWCRGIEL